MTDSRLDWASNTAMVKYVLKLREQGKSFSEVAVEFKKKYGVKITKDQARHVAVTYGPDEEFSAQYDGKMLLSARRSQNAARVANKSVREVADLALTQEAALDAVREAVKGIKKGKSPIFKARKNAKGKKMSVELLLSDWQIGKTMKGYDSEIAIRRLREYTGAAINEVKRRLDQGYNVEKIVLVMLGDIIESAEKAVQKNSARSVDSSTAEQLELSIKHLYLDLIKPMAELGIDLDVVAVTGNHDHEKPGMVYYNPGKEHLTWTIYKSLELLSAEANLNVKFDIPVGYFTTYDFYGQTALYEHGYGLAATEASLNSRRNDRMKQLKKYVDYFRMGDKHNICRFNDDSLVVNGAFFGNDDSGSEYSSIAGYSSVASQIMFFHVPRDDERKTVYDSFSIQLHHIK